MNGLATIRASDAESILIEEFENHQDYIRLVGICLLKQTFGLTLDFMFVTFMCVVTFLFLTTDSSGSDAEIFQLFDNSMCLRGLIPYCKVCLKLMLDWS